MGLDYSKIGFKAGIEIHQQLDTNKLFCSCPSYLRSEEPDFIIRRKLHRVAGETGEVDTAVEYEASLDREFIYECYNDTICLVELDEEPPHVINEVALDEALKIALLLNCEIYQISQIMRKTVIDGSNTSGFQRTVLIGHDGFVETSFGRVKIESVALEEDSARIILKDAKTATYRLDRLGIPLVEIGTAPDMRTPEQIKETALKLGEILRACKVKRGIGTIRQDINISIKGHEKVEIKGFQEPAIMIKTAELEAERQIQDLKNGKKAGEVRNVLEDGSTEFLRPLPGRARMYPETDLPLLRISRDKLNELKKNLPRLRKEIRDELKKIGLNEELIVLVLDGNIDEFNVLMNVYGRDANLVAKMVTLWRSEFASKYKKSISEVKEILTEAVLEKILENVAQKKLNEGDVKFVMQRIMEGSEIDDALNINKIDDNLLEEEIDKLVRKNPGLRANAYMGLIIKKYGNSFDKRRAMEILNRLLNS